MPGIAVTDHAELYRICEAVTVTGLPLFIHSHDQSLYEMFVERATARWGRDFRSYARAWVEGDGVVMDSGIATMLELQRATGVRLHVLHLSTIEGFRLVREAKREGRAVTSEVNPSALFLESSWENVERLGPYSLGVWVPERHAIAIWDAIEHGEVDVIATDHAPHARVEKEVGWTDMYAAPGGSPNIQHYLPLLLNAVREGRLTLDQVVELTSSGPARLTGFHPRKGRIAPGSDADLVVIDLDRTEVVSAATSHYKCGWTPYEGHSLTGWPVLTVLRGKVIADHGKVLNEGGDGQLVRPHTPAGTVEVQR
jgi:dihydroorotase-like cyclic amidohydrolase